MAKTRKEQKTRKTKKPEKKERVIFDPEPNVVLQKAPIAYWSHSSLMSFLRNPLAWHKRYVEGIYDTPSSPAGIIGRAGHVALQHFYSGLSKEGAVDLGLEHLREVADFEINFGKARTKEEKQKKRQSMEEEYTQAVGFYLAKPPVYKIVGVEIKAHAEVEGLALPIKAVSDLVVESRTSRNTLDIVDHKFVDAFSAEKEHKTLFVIQALFNYYTVREKYGKKVGKFILHECRKKRNADGSPQMRKYVIDYKAIQNEFEVFHRLINDATAEISRTRVFLPNPSDMFEGENSFDIYKLGLGG